MTHDVVRLKHILQAIAAIEGFVKSGNRDFLVESAVIRHIAVIGEASRHLSPALRKQHSDIPWKDIVGMRHILIHDYFEFNPSFVWDTVDNDLPGFKEKIQTILRSLEA